MTETDRDSVIEAAMRNHARPTAAEHPAPAPHTIRTSVGRREYDQALAHRLEQLHHAMGESDQEALIMPPANPMPVATADRYTFHLRTLVITALASALLGAGLTWHALGSNGSAESLPPSAGIMPSAPPTAPVPASVSVVTALRPSLKTDEEQVRELLEAWRQAWSQRDVEAYLSHYSPDFVPTKGQKRPEWVAERRKNLSSRSQISINVHDLQIERLAEDRMKLAFLQDYAAGSYRENAQAKTLLLVRKASSWLILGEWQGAEPAPAALR